MSSDQSIKNPSTSPSAGEKRKSDGAGDDSQSKRPRSSTPEPSVPVPAAPLPTIPPTGPSTGSSGGDFGNDPNLPPVIRPFSLKYKKSKKDILEYIVKGSGIPSQFSPRGLVGDETYDFPRPDGGLPFFEMYTKAGLFFPIPREMCSFFEYYDTCPSQWTSWTIGLIVSLFLRCRELGGAFSVDVFKYFYDPAQVDQHGLFYAVLRKGRGASPISSNYSRNTSWKNKFILYYPAAGPSYSDGPMPITWGTGRNREDSAIDLTDETRRTIQLVLEASYPITARPALDPSQILSWTVGKSLVKFEEMVSKAKSLGYAPRTEDLGTPSEPSEVHFLFNLSNSYVIMLL